MEFEVEQCNPSSEEPCPLFITGASNNDTMTMSALAIVLGTTWLLYWALSRLLLFVAILNIIPLMVFVFLYTTSIYCHLYKTWNHIGEDLVFTASVYERARNNIAWGWDLIGKIWFGFEIQGLENLPKEGGAILAYYHGTIPIDIYFIISKIRLECNRSLNTVADRFVYKLHGLKLLWRIFAVNIGTREVCVRILKEGNLLAIAPGGTREAYFSGNTYTLMWGQRKGFAKVAMEAKVPIIPVFTRNCREAFRTPKLGRGILRWLYEKTRAPLVPIYGGFPVKLKTFIGPPIQWDPQMTVDDIVQKAHEAVEGLVHKHQKIPGSIRRAFLERFYDSEEKEE
ncbi:transmembrane protein 68 [Strongylocentrotus purpuratus]|uniref:Phospholipid/glycerol acyltransferase domain-containing protein n=1 Tax=Strongylocentrotus purpuratus TaxID=7668 RepID=A0A7M7NN88_STRPU|nr:transmembrane protein 68 [Strongylocentrotus purpuratus]